MNQSASGLDFLPRAPTPARGFDARARGFKPQEMQMSETQVIRFRATSRDRERLDRLADEMEAASRSDVIRRLIKAEHERVATRGPYSSHKDAIAE